jgi:hypothetical protein
MLAATPEEHWERLAADPYFAVLTDGRYDREGLTEEALAEFFRSVQTHVARVLSDSTREEPTHAVAFQDGHQL